MTRQNQRLRTTGVVVAMTMAAMTAGACSDDATPGQAGSSTTSTAGDGAGVTTTPGKRGDATAVIDPGDGGRYRPQIDPARFVERIDNRYFPLTPGASWVYEGRWMVRRNGSSWS